MVDFNRSVYCLLGLPYDAVDLAAAARRIRVAAARRTRLFVSTANVNFLVSARSDRPFRESVMHSDLSLVDGMPLVWMSRLLQVPLRERVAGSNLFERLRAMPGPPLRIFFFGGPDGVADAACQEINAAPSGLRCVGALFPGHGSVEEMSGEEPIAKINACKPDFVIVSLGAEKGQAWIMRNRERLAASVVSHLGAVVNFAAGTVKRAPPWMQRAGLEWAWRIGQERPLWRRYASDGRVLLRLLVTHVIPLAWSIYRGRITGKHLEPAAVEVIGESGDLVVRLHGAWIRERLGPLRYHFSEVARSGRDLRIDLDGVSYVDAWFLGLLLLLYASQERNRKKLVCEPVSPAVRRALRLACLEFLAAGGSTAKPETS